MPTPKTTPATKPPPIPTSTPVHAHTETLGLSRFAMAHPIEKHSPAAVKPVARDGEEDIQAIPGVAASDLRAGTVSTSWALSTLLSFADLAGVNDITRRAHDGAIVVKLDCSLRTCPSS